MALAVEICMWICYFIFALVWHVLATFQPLPVVCLQFWRSFREKLFLKRYISLAGGMEMSNSLSLSLSPTLSLLFYHFSSSLILILSLFHNLYSILFLSNYILYISSRLFHYLPFLFSLSFYHSHSYQLSFLFDPFSVSFSPPPHLSLSIHQSLLISVSFLFSLSVFFTIIVVLFPFLLHLFYSIFPVHVLCYFLSGLFYFFVIVSILFYRCHFHSVSLVVYH